MIYFDRENIIFAEKIKRQAKFAAGQKASCRICD